MSMPSTARDGHYTLHHVQVSLGVPRSVISGLVGAGFVKPAIGPRNEQQFSFQDLMLLRTAHELRQSKVPPRRIVEALSKLRSALPEGAALTGVRMSALGSRVIVRDGQGVRDAASGQFVMDFDAGSETSAATAQAKATAAPTAPHAKRKAQLHVLVPRAQGAPQAAPASLAANDASSTHDADALFAVGEGSEAADPSAAEAAYRRALAIDPGHMHAGINLSALLAERDRAAEADAVCVALLGRDVDHALLRFNHALALEDMKRPRAALDAYRRAIELDANFADAHYNAACLLESLNDTRGALRHFNAYRKLQGL